MSDHVLKTIEEAEGQLREKEQEIATIKRTINYLCVLAKMPERYGGVDAASANRAVAATLKIAGDEFFGLPLNTAVTKYLNMRRAANSAAGPSTPEEIQLALLEGGYVFEQQRKDEQLHSLKTSLGKSSHTFARLSNGNYALLEWYPNATVKKKTRRVGEPAAPNGTAGHSATESVAEEEGMSDPEK